MVFKVYNNLTLIFYKASISSTFFHASHFLLLRYDMYFSSSVSFFLPLTQPRMSGFHLHLSKFYQFFKVHFKDHLLPPFWNNQSFSTFSSHFILQHLENVLELFMNASCLQHSKIFTRHIFCINAIYNWIHFSGNYFILSSHIEFCGQFRPLIS